MIRLRVKEIAQAKGMSQAELMRRSGMDLKTVRRILRDPFAIITTESLDRLADALNVDAHELFEWKPNNKNSAVDKFQEKDNAELL